MRHAFLAVLLLAVVALTGCGGGAESTVSGTVSFDGKPVEKGAIKFVHATTPGGAVITNGQFETKLAPGSYKVEVTAPKVAGTRKQKGFDGKEEVIEQIEELIPECYNVKTELTEEIKSGANTVKLVLLKK